MDEPPSSNHSISKVTSKMPQLRFSGGPERPITPPDRPETPKHPKCDPPPYPTASPLTLPSPNLHPLTPTYLIHLPYAAISIFLNNSFSHFKITSPPLELLRMAAPNCTQLPYSCRDKRHDYTSITPQLPTYTYPPRTPILPSHLTTFTLPRAYPPITSHSTPLTTTHHPITS